MLSSPMVKILVAGVIIVGGLFFLFTTFDQAVATEQTNPENSKDDCHLWYNGIYSASAVEVCRLRKLLEQIYQIGELGPNKKCKCEEKK